MPREPSPGYRQTLEALRRSKPEPSIPPQVQAARDRQTEQLRAHREPEAAFAAAADFEAELREQEERRRSHDVQEQALRRARTERAASRLPSIAPTRVESGQAADPSASDWRHTA